MGPKSPASWCGVRDGRSIGGGTWLNKFAPGYDIRGNDHGGKVKSRLVEFYSELLPVIIGGIIFEDQVQGCISVFSST